MGRIELPDKHRDEDLQFDDAGNPDTRQVLAPLDRGVRASTVSARPVSELHRGSPLAFLQERIAVVGNRKGANMKQAVDFIDALHRAQPDSILVSGGAAGLDQMAESTWFRLGGRIRSYRPAPYDVGFGVEIWNYGGTEPAEVLPVQEQRVQFADYKSAALYRDWMIACDCDRLVAFYRDRGAQMQSGTAGTEAMARDRNVPVYTFVAPAEVAA